MPQAWGAYPQPAAKGGRPHADSDFCLSRVRQRNVGRRRIPRSRGALSALPAGSAGAEHGPRGDSGHGGDLPKPHKKSSDSIFDAPMDEGESAAAVANSTTVFLSSKATHGGGVAPRNTMIRHRVPGSRQGPDRHIRPTAETAQRMRRSGAAGTSVKRPGVAGLLVILIPYAILMTHGMVLLQGAASRYPLEMLPDWPRDNERPTRPQRISAGRRFPTTAGSAAGQAGPTIRVGGEVLRKVERRGVSATSVRLGRNLHGHRPGADSPRPAARRTALFPTTSFNRKWRDGMPIVTDRTCLEIGSTRFYGGPCEWKPQLRRTRSPNSLGSGQCVQPGEIVMSSADPGMAVS